MTALLPFLHPLQHKNAHFVEQVQRNGNKKTAREALHNWKSTYAAKHLRKVVEEALPLEGMPLFASVKEGVQKKNGYKNMILLYYT